VRGDKGIDRGEAEAVGALWTGLLVRGDKGIDRGEAEVVASGTLFAREVAVACAATLLRNDQ
jgi:hypothetical protein